MAIRSSWTEPKSSCAAGIALTVTIVLVIQLAFLSDGVECFGVSRPENTKEFRLIRLSSFDIAPWQHRHPKQSYLDIQHKVSSSVVSLQRSSSSNDVAKSESESIDQWTDIWNGWNDLISGDSIDTTKVSDYWRSPSDVVATLAMLPLTIEAFRTALTGTFDEGSYLVCAAVTLFCAIAHLQMTLNTPRDFRAPRLAEPRTVYEFSYLYLFAFSWFLWRVNLASALPAPEALDGIGIFGLCAVTLYGVLIPLYSRSLLDQPFEQSGLEPSPDNYREQAKLLCTGNIVINVLACLFLPFVVTLCLWRGSEWWDRVQVLHEHQAAFMGVSLLVAILGDMSGNALLRIKEFGIITQYNSLVSLGIVSNFLLLLFPELIFNGLYFDGISEVGFYWE